MDIPFVRFAFPIVILCAYWYAFVISPWQELASTGADPNSPSGNAQAMLLESRSLIALGKSEQALAPLQNLHKSFPENPIYMQGLAEAYEHLSRYPEAIEMWEKFLEYSATPIEACPQIGLDYRRSNQPKRALDAFERCLRIEENADTLLFYANALEREGRPREALDFYRKAVDTQPDYPDAIIGLARVEAHVGRAADARPRVDEMLKRRPDNVEVLVVASLVYSHLGQRDKALNYLHRVRELDPDQPDVALLTNELLGRRRSSRKAYP